MKYPETENKILEGYFHMGFEFKLQDFWIGFFWKREEDRLLPGYFPDTWHIWICFIPCFPLHIEFRQTEKQKGV